MPVNLIYYLQLVDITFKEFAIQFLTGRFEDQPNVIPHKWTQPAEPNGLVDIKLIHGAVNVQRIE